MTRAYGTGSLHFRRSDSRWIGRLPDGRGGYKYVTGTDHDDVRRRLDELRRQRDRTTSRSHRGGERLAMLLDRYLSTVAPMTNRPRTLEDHRWAEGIIAPVIGGIRVAQLDVGDVQKVVRTMQGRGYSPKSIRNVIGVLSTVLEHARRERTITENVARLATLPPVERKTLPSLSTDQLRAFLDATRGDEMWPVWVLAGTTGLRLGEVLGLLWRDVSPDPNSPQTITVTGQYRRVGVVDGRVRWERAEPKTERSRRTLHLPALAREALRVQRAQATSAKLVFSRRDGQPLAVVTVRRRLRKALKEAGLPHVRFHAMRHTAASLMLDATGGDLRAVSAVLGHAHISTSVDLYGREADVARKRAAEAVDRALEGIG